MTDTSYVVFHRGGSRFALPLAQVRRVIHPRHLTPVPRPAPGVIGMLESRGIVYTILQTPLPPPAQDNRGRILLVQGDVSLGLVVDGVEGVRETEAPPLPGERPAPSELGALDAPPPPECRHVLGPALVVAGARAWTLDLAALSRDAQEGEA